MKEIEGETLGAPQEPSLPPEPESERSSEGPGSPVISIYAGYVLLLHEMESVGGIEYDRVPYRSDDEFRRLLYGSSDR